MTRLFALSLFVFTACASSKPEPKPTTPAADPAPAAAAPPAGGTADDMQAVCVQSFTRDRTCTAEYIPSLVDVRAKLDQPPGIAAQVKQDRAGVIAKAQAEWAEDSKDEHIAAHCTQMTAHLPDAARALGDAVRGCLAKADCASYVACMEPVEEQLMAAHGGAAHP